jgi:hypothetical protein
LATRQDRPTSSFARAAEHDGNHVGVAAQAAQRLGGQRCAVGRLAHRPVVQSGDEGLVVGEHRHLRHRSGGAVTAGAAHKLDDCVGLQLVPGAVVGSLVVVAGGGDGTVDRRPHLGVGQRVERQQAVDPAAHVALPAQPLLP